MNELHLPEILWTNAAKSTLNKIIEYLRKEWSEKEAENFLRQMEEMLFKLKRYPEMCRPSLKRKHVRIGILNKHTQLIYHYNSRKNKITILLFWGMKQAPSKFRY